MTRVRQYELIRRDHILHSLSIRALARKYHIHRREVRAALRNAVPAPRKKTERPAPVLGPFKATIVEWLEADRKAPPKQRHTARRIWSRLRDEFGCTAAESTVRREVARIRRQIGLVEREAFVPQLHLPGEEAEVDFYEAEVFFPDGPRTLYHFCMRACYSGKEFHMAFPKLNQQSFLEAHVEAFAYFGAVFPVIRYDNLTEAVKKVLKGRQRIESDRFIALRSHYLFESVFCLPGEQGAHEKGGVEGGLGRFRRNHLVPVPRAESLEGYNDFLRGCMAKDDERVIEGRRLHVSEAWQDEVGKLRPLPAHPFDTDEVTKALVDMHGRVRVAGNRYSVPITLHGLTVEVRRGARMITILHEGRVVARHERAVATGKDILMLDHYLDLLSRRPGAFAGSLVLAQARERGEWPALYDHLHEAFKERFGLSKGTRELVDVLLLHREFGAPEVHRAVERALELGCLEAAAIRHLAKQGETPVTIPPALLGLGDLARHQVSVPSLSAFDALIGGRAS